MSIKGLDEFLKANDLNPDEVFKIDGRMTSVFTFVEASVMGAFDMIEECQDNMEADDDDDEQ